MGQSSGNNNQNNNAEGDGDGAGQTQRDPPLQQLQDEGGPPLSSASAVAVLLEDGERKEARRRPHPFLLFPLLPHAEATGKIPREPLLDAK